LTIRFHSYTNITKSKIYNSTLAHSSTLTRSAEAVIAAASIQIAAERGRIYWAGSPT
jgi:hypothetical protein